MSERKLTIGEIVGAVAGAEELILRGHARPEHHALVQLSQQRDYLLVALQRAERDLLAIMGDDQGKIDPAFARERVQAAIARVKS